MLPACVVFVLSELEFSLSFDHQSMMQCGRMCCWYDSQDEVVFPNRQGTLLVKPARSSLSPERVGTSKTVHFTAEDEVVEEEPETKQMQKKSSFMELLHLTRRGAASGKVDELDQIKFHELLALNLPDWYLVLLGVISSALLGALFPLMSVIISGVLEVSVGPKL